MTFVKVPHWSAAGVKEKQRQPPANLPIPACLGGLFTLFFFFFYMGTYINLYARAYVYNAYKDRYNIIYIIFFPRTNGLIGRLCARVRPAVSCYWSPPSSLATNTTGPGTGAHTSSVYVSTTQRGKESDVVERERDQQCRIYYYYYYYNTPRRTTHAFLYVTKYFVSDAQRRWLLVISIYIYIYAHIM